MLIFECSEFLILLGRSFMSKNNQISCMAVTTKYPQLYTMLFQNFKFQIGNLLLFFQLILFKFRNPS